MLFEARFAHTDSAGLFEEVARLALPVDLSAGQQLFAEGDPGDSMYLVREGEVEVSLRQPDGSSLMVNRIGPGDTVGEMALLTGQPRSASVRAISPARLLRLSRERFDALADANPKIAHALAEAIAPRFRTRQIAGVLSHLFGDLSLEALRDVEARLVWTRVGAGQTLFRAGDPGGALYVVVNGRLQFVRERSNGAHEVVAEVERGETAGEAAVLTGDPYDVSAIARRDTYAVRLDRADFDILAERHSRLTRVIAQVAAHRSRPRRGPGAPRAPLVLCIVPAQPDIAPEIWASFTRDFALSLAALGPTEHLNAARFDAECGRSGLAQTPAESPTDIMIAGWLNERESRCAHLLLEADPAWTPWTQRVTAMADRVLVVADARGSPDCGPVELTLRERLPSAIPELALLHPADTALPRDTLRWLTPRGSSRHYHARRGDPAHLARIARAVTGQAVGLALSGGAARGFAHIGAIRALTEAGWVPDVYGGTSMGALIAAAGAAGRTPEELATLAAKFGNPRLIYDPTLPVSSLFESRKVSRLLETLFGDARIEDLWTPFFCVSTNLSRAAPRIHERGLLWRAVRASSSIAGVFAPITEDGDLLVDGSTVNSWPVDLMRERVGNGLVIGINVNPDVERSQPYVYGDSLSGFRAAWHRFNPFLPRSRRLRMPLLSVIMTRLSLLSDARATEAKKACVDILISPETKPFNAMDFSNPNPLIEEGYRAAKRVLLEHPAAAVSPPHASP